MMTITVGFTAGGAVAGFVARAMIPQFGWQSVFLVGGVIPLVIAIAMLVSLPESLQFLAVRRRRLDQVARWLKKLDPTIRSMRRPSTSPTKSAGRRPVRAPVPRRAIGLVTVLLWIVNFMNLLNLYSVWRTGCRRSSNGMGYDPEPPCSSARCCGSAARSARSAWRG